MNPPPPIPREYTALRSAVHTRGIPPESFLAELVAWGRRAPDVIFTKNNNWDIYDAVWLKLGPYETTLHRRACMLEVLRVLAGFESSWNSNEGRDLSNPASNKPETTEAGAWQVSADSLRYGRDLASLMIDRTGHLDPEDFQAAMKRDHEFAMEYTARLLRHTTRHHGPVRDRHITPWLRRDAVREFEKLLA